MLWLLIVNSTINIRILQQIYLLIVDADLLSRPKFHLTGGRHYEKNFTLKHYVSMGNKQCLIYFKDHPNNLKAADLVKENRQINQQLSGFMNDIFSIFEFSKKKAMQAGKYIVGHAELINNSTAFNAK